MNAQDTFKMHGAMTAALTRADGSVEVRHKDNMIVDVGFDFIADAIGKAVGRPEAMSHIAVGTGGTAPQAGNEALLAELASSRQAATYEHTPGTKTFSFTATFAPGVATGAIKEAAVVNAATAGILLDRVSFAVINKGDADTLIITFTFTMS